MNRGATIRVIHSAPQWQPPAFVRPEGVVELQETLDDAKNMLINPSLLNHEHDARLYGPGPCRKTGSPLTVTLSGGSTPRSIS